MDHQDSGRVAIAKTHRQMRKYGPYVQRLAHLLTDAWRDELASPAIDRTLDGEPSRELKRLVPLSSRRASGAFFTGADLAAKVAGLLRPTLDANSVIFDPACGAGDLLLACVDLLPVPSSLDDTLAKWTNCLIGRDIHRQFVHAAKLRLALKALTKFGSPKATRPAISNFFTDIRVRSGLADREAYQKASHLILNPPFGMVQAPMGCSWAEGLVTEAALFIESAVGMSRPGTQLVAILPDVLRSGSRYAKWRTMVSRQASHLLASVHGLFDDSADVDVFILSLIISQGSQLSQNSSWTEDLTSSYKVVSDVFEVHVGPVVDFRDAHRGRWQPYLVAKSLPVRSEVVTVSRKRRSDKRLFSPPFVAVRRMSRPGDVRRANATLIRSGDPVAVDNHLLALIPRDRSLATCRELMSILERPETNVWLNNRIRCRHLTVTALGELPWWETR